MMGLRLEQHFAGPPIPPAVLPRLLRSANKDGFTHFTLDPPTMVSEPVEHAPIAYLIRQADAKVRARTS